MVLSIVRSSQYIKGSQPCLNKATSCANSIEEIGPVTGPSIASMRNFGAKQARGEWILFVDEDCEINEKKVLKLIEKMEKKNSSLGAFAGVYKQKTHSKIQKTYDRIQRLWVLKGLQEKRSYQGNANHLLGGCLIVKRQAWEKACGFNEKIGWGGEEFDFILRLQKAGYQTAVTYSLRVPHSSQIGIFGFIKRAWRQNYNRGFYKIKPEEKLKNKMPTSFLWKQPMFTSLFATVAIFGFFSGALTYKIVSLIKA